MTYDFEIREYNQKLQDLERNGARTEGQLRKAFSQLLDRTASKHGMLLLEEQTEEAQGKKGNVRYDGMVKREGSIAPHGYWEAKDKQDSLLHEVVRKQKAGCKFFNILFEDTKTFMLYQDEKQVLEGSLLNESELSKGLELFYSYRNKYEEDYQKALEQFKQGIPALAAELHAAIEQLNKSNDHFKNSVKELEKNFRECNSGISSAAVHEFMVQHCLTIDLFRSIFNVQNFEKFNPIAKRMDELVLSTLKREQQKIVQQVDALLRAIQAVLVRGYATPADKQQVLITVYEEFFKAHNPKKADTHGIVYTPPQAVDFMIRSCDELMHQHFGKQLHSEGVRILDPCTGTGTFVTRLLRHIPCQHLERKLDDIYAVEVDVMAYYMAQMNIEEAYRQAMGQPNIERSYEKLALADALEIPTVHKDAGQELFASYASITEQNARLVEELQASDYLLILGNPPYNSAQKNESENNRNKRYDFIDKRSRESYTANSTAQKPQTTDMYIRFFRWASDKLLSQHKGNESAVAEKAMQGAHAINSRGGGMLCFISNRSYIDKLFTDGIRKTWVEEWDHIYVLDLGGDLRSQPKDPQTGRLKGNIFNIQTGVAICWLLKKDEPAKDSQKSGKQSAEIHYAAVDDYLSGQEKLDWLTQIQSVSGLQQQGLFEKILPDERGNWLRQGERDFAGFLSMGNKEFKAGREGSEAAIFKLYSNGVKTNRDEWVYDFSRENLQTKMQFFIEHYEQKRKTFWEEWQEEDQEEKLSRNDKGTLNTDQKALQDWLGMEIKWSSTLRNNFITSLAVEYYETCIIPSLYRPFVKQYFYCAHEVNDRLTAGHDHIFGATGTLENVCIGVSGPAHGKLFFIHAIAQIPSLDYVEKTMLFPHYRYVAHTREDILAKKTIKKIDNISDEALEYFSSQEPSQKTITKDHIFAYIYGLLHKESYRTKYADNLRQELPRIPVLKEFWQIAEIGKKLMDLHLNWDTDKCPTAHFELKEGIDSEQEGQELSLGSDSGDGHQKHYPLKEASVLRPARLPKTIKYSPSSVKDKETGKHTGKIKISNALSLGNVPVEAWQYTLGGRSAIDWVLEFYKESKNTCKDPSLAAMEAHGKEVNGKNYRLKPYSLADYEEQLLDTLQRIINVSCEHVRLLGDLKVP